MAISKSATIILIGQKWPLLMGLLSSAHIARAQWQNLKNNLESSKDPPPRIWSCQGMAKVPHLFS